MYAPIKLNFPLQRKTAFWCSFNHVPKDPVMKEQRTDAIYSIPCNDCDNKYIGQTKRRFGTFGTRTLHVQNLIPIWVDPNNKVQLLIQMLNLIKSNWIGKVNMTNEYFSCKCDEGNSRCSEIKGKDRLTRTPPMWLLWTRHIIVFKLCFLLTQTCL